MAVNRPSALVRACVACHGHVESHRDEARELGLLVARPGVPGEVPVFLRTVYGEAWFRLTDDGMYVFA